MCCVTLPGHAPPPCRVVHGYEQAFAFGQDERVQPRVESGARPLDGLLFRGFDAYVKAAAPGCELRVEAERVEVGGAGGHQNIVSAGAHADAERRTVDVGGPSVELDLLGVQGRDVDQQ